jgi:hypothetical protein
MRNAILQVTAKMIQFLYLKRTQQVTIKVVHFFFTFLHGEGPRSRCYGHTTALRLFVQPYDEDGQIFTKFYK